MAAALLAACHRPGGAGGAVLWSLPDPSGDDHGDGDLRYPGDADLSPGDLDLLELRALRAPGGTLFEASFARPIRRPDARAVSPTGESLEQVARLGFYTFNIDVYVDQDRIPGSGRTRTLPGRKAEVDPAAAWEKAVCLTPRPAEARDLLRAIWGREAERASADRKEALDAAGQAALAAGIEGEVDRVFFPRQVRVAGNRVSFFVPDAFLGGSADAHWAYVVAVSGAGDLSLKFDLPALLGRGGGESVFIRGIVPGYSLTQFGGGHLNDPLQPPLVDVVVPPGASQEAILKKGPEPGLPVRLPGVVPADLPPR